MFKVLIDFDNNATYAHDVSDFVLQQATFEHGIEPYERVADESAADLVLDNTDRRFSPENTLSPYYPNVRPNIRIKLVFNTVTLWVGYTEIWETAPLLYGERIARLRCKGVKWILENIDAELPLYTNRSADYIIEQILAISGIFPPGALVWGLGILGFSALGETTVLGDASDFGVLDPGQEIIPRVGHNYRNDIGTYNLYEVIRDVVHAECGRFWFAGNGTAQFRNRQAWLQQQATDRDCDNDFNLTPEYASAQNEVKNRIVVKGETVAEGSAPSVVWELAAPLYFSGGQSVSWVVAPINANSNRITSVKDVVTPTGADFVWTSGGGTIEIEDLAQNIVVTVTATSPGILGTLVIRATELKSSQFSVVAEDADSVARYKRIERSFEIKVVDNPQKALDIAYLELRRFADDTPRMTSIAYERGFDELTDSDDLIVYEVGSLFRVQDAQTAHDRIYRVLKVLRQLDIDARRMTVTYFLEPSEAGIWWLLGEAGSSELGETTVLAF